MDQLNSEVAGALSLGQLCSVALHELLMRAYSRRTVNRYTLVLKHLAEFTREQNLGNEYSRSLAMHFEEVYGLRDGERLKPTERWRQHLVSALCVLDEYARTGGVVRFVVEASGLRIPQPMQKPLRDYEQFARERRHLRRSSLQERMHGIAVFLDFLRSRGVMTLEQMQSEDISAFIASRSRWRPKTVAHVASHLRLFLQYLFVRGTLPRDFSSAVPTIIKAYRDVFTLLLRFSRDMRSVAVERLSLAHVDASFVEAFLDHLGTDRHCSVRTQNQRLAALHAFFRYVQSEAPECLLQCQKILAIPLRRHAQSSVGYLSKEQLAPVLAHPDLATRSGRRDAVLLSVLYDTGARVQELIDLNADDVRLTSPAQVRLFGKGRKVRVVPLMDATAHLLRDHVRECCLDGAHRGHQPLFQNRHGGRMSRSGIRYLLHSHVQAVRSSLAGFTQSVSPHSLRHTKGMHLLQGGVPLEIIRDFLGHVDVKTTQIYARANLEMKRRALEKVAEAPLPTMPSWQQNPNLLDWLRSL